MYEQGEVADIGNQRLEVVRFLRRDRDGMDIYEVKPHGSYGRTSEVTREWMARYDWHRPHTSPK